MFRLRWQVYWLGNSTWYGGTVIGYDDGRLQLKYSDDGLEEWVYPESEIMWLCTRFVWARMKPHLWAPAMVRIWLACVWLLCVYQLHARAGAAVYAQQN